MTQLDDLHKAQVTRWITDGMKLSDIQNRLRTEFGIALTYMEVRFLVDDLKLVPKDVEPSKPTHTLGKTEEAAPAAAAAPTAPVNAPVPAVAEEPAPDAVMGSVSVSVDKIARPGAMISGGVTFSDGSPAAWYIDEQGRLGLVPKTAGYRPSPADIQEFQMQLQAELARMGM